jgi:hypothetical protein
LPKDPPNAGYHVFLSYSGEERAVVEEIGTELKGLGLKVWFDRWVLPPGEPWQRHLLEGVEQSAATLLFVGPNGLGRWQEEELGAAINKRVAEGNHRIVPAILPGVSPDQIKLPLILKNFTWVLLQENLHDRVPLERLYCGITGAKYVAQPGPRDSSTKPGGGAIDHATADLREVLKTDNITYFVGTGAANGGDSMPPSASEITRGLLVDLHLIDSSYDKLLPPVDVASAYYAAEAGASRLERRIVDMVSARSGEIPKLHGQIAELIRLLSKRPKLRSRNRMQQLIVSTNLDLLMERALLRAGVSFTRLVQNTAACKIEVNRYDKVSRSAERTISLGDIAVDADNWDELDDAIANYGRSSVAGSEGESPGTGALHKLPIKELCGDDPILYKFRGSQDVRGSCALSVDQYLRYLRGLLRQVLVPAQITEILNSTPLLLFGYGYFDPEFRLVYHGLLRQTLELGLEPVYSVQLPPDRQSQDAYRRMELDLWERMKDSALRELKINTLEAASEEILEALLETLRTQPAAA